MANNIINTRIQQRYDSFDNWKNQNPILLVGEVATVRFADGTVRTKTGNGTLAFNSLPWDDKNLYDNNTAIPKIGDGNVVWGGPNLQKNVNPIDAAMVPELGANRFAFLPPDAITVEYSRDGGTTWIDYGLSDGVKTQMFSGLTPSSGPTIGHITSTDSENCTTDCKLRITITTQPNIVYATIKKIIINISTGYTTGSNVTIENSTYGKPDNFHIIQANVPIGGWSGYNVINNLDMLYFGGNASQINNFQKIRLTFGITGVNESYPKSALQVLNIYGFGGNFWKTSSTMAKTGHIYAYDESQNAIFPNKVKSSVIPDADNDLTNKKYVDTKIASISSVSKNYVDEQDAKKLDKVITQSVDLSAFEIINSNSENEVTNTTVTMTYGGTVTIGCKNKKVGFTITGDSDTSSIPIKYNDSVIYVNQTPQTIEPILMTTDLVIDNSNGYLGGTFTFSDMITVTEVTPDKYYTQESLFVESNTAKLIDKNLKTTDFDITWQGSSSGSFQDTPSSNLNLQITYDSYPVILSPKGDLAGKEYNLEYNTNASMGAPSMRIYTSAEDTTGTFLEVSSEHNNSYTGKIYKIEIQFGLNTSVNMAFKTKVSQMGLMSAEDKTNLSNLQTKIGDISSALDSILTIQNNLLGGNS